VPIDRLLALPFIMLAYLTILIAAVAGSVQIGLIVCDVELSLGVLMLAALSPLIMLRADEIRIWHGFRFINIGISEIAGVGMLYAIRQAPAAAGASPSGGMTDRMRRLVSPTCAAGVRALHPGRADDGIGPARRTTTRSPPARSQP
jgi:hypothetical protein